MMELVLHFINAYLFGLLQYSLLAVAAYFSFQPCRGKRATISSLAVLVLFTWGGTLALEQISFFVKISFSMLTHAFAWRLIFEEKFGKLFFFNLVLYYELMISDFIVGSLTTTATGDNIFFFMASGAAGRFLVSCCSFVCMTTIIVITFLYFRKLTFEIPNKYWCIVDIVIFLCYIISLLVMGLNEYTPMRQYSATTLLLSILFPVLFFLILKMFVDLCRFFQSETQIVVTQISNDALQRQLAVQDKAVQDMRQVRHDMKNHILSLSAFLRTSDTSGALTYLENLTEAVNTAGLAPYCKSAVVNSILTVKMSEASHAALTICLSIDPDFNISLPAVDLTCILANLLDNAMDAVQTLDAARRTIQVQIGKYNAFSYFRVSNPYRGKLRRRGDTILTSKSDTTSHGYGIESVKAASLRCGGMLQINDENQIFTATAFVKDRRKN